MTAAIQPSMLKRAGIFIGALALILATISMCSTKADAKPRKLKRTHSIHQSVPACTFNNDGRVICMGSAGQPQSGRSLTVRQVGRVALMTGATVIGGRPAGCPHRYCGCGLRKYLGIEDKSLDLAWNWARKFHRTSAAPGAVAVRHGHVMMIVSHVSGSNYIVRDYNGGRGLSYIHERSVRGYVFVNPSSRVAMQ